MDNYNDSRAHYDKARAKGRSEVNRAKSRAENDDLIALNEKINHRDLSSTVEIGLREIKLKKVVGTYYKSRSNIFSPDFSPLPTPDTEFALKWINLCNAHVKEGIRDPIFVYEYLNYYYVQEGNKRVSVLKYFDSDAISANVIRLIPQYNERDEEIRKYYAFLEFYNLTNFENIWFSNEESFKKMILVMNTLGYEGNYNEFLRMNYPLFRLEYKKIEKESELTTGDVFLKFIEVYGLDKYTVEELKIRIPQIIGENTITEVVDLDDKVVEEQKSSFSLANILSAKTKIGFAFNNDPDEDEWANAHYQGMLHVKEKFDKHIHVDYIKDTSCFEDPYMALKHFVEEGFDVVFICSSELKEIARKCAVEFPKTHFLVCAWDTPTFTTTNYYGRVYQTSFLMGIYASIISETNEVSFIAKSIKPHVITYLNAFALGARSVNPNAVVNYYMEESAIFEQPETTICIYRDDQKRAPKSIGTVNSYLIYKDQIKPVAYTLWRWEKFYEKMINTISNGSYKKVIDIYKGKRKVINFWWGLNSGVVDFRFDPFLVPRESEAVLNAIRFAIKEDELKIFRGPLIDTEGNIKAENYQNLPLEDLFDMDWLVDIVVPKFDLNILKEALKKDAI